VRSDGHLYAVHASNAIRRDLEQCALGIIEVQRGIVVKGLGDGLMVAFQSAWRAIACAREIQLSPVLRFCIHA
jgi:class 3 adenylate cyclase